MKKAIVALTMIIVSGYALASCPPYAPYGCKQGMNGKMICGCGIR
jgi:hypothetical protein